jgi:hypothetical protein
MRLFERLDQFAEVKVDQNLKAALAVLALGVNWIFLSVARADDQAEIAKLMADATEQQHVMSAAKKSTVALQNPCPTAQYSIEKKFSPHQPVSLDSAGKIVTGEWKQVVDEQGCGIHRLLNVLVWAQESKGLSVMPLLPSTTHADFALQKDAVRFAVQALATVPGGREANCQIGYVADTEFIEQENTTLPGAKGSSWRELWTLASCTQKMLVPMHFIPDATGTSISAGPNTAIKVVPLADGHL